MTDMKQYMPLMRDKMMIHGMHVYTGDVVTIPKAGFLYYSGYGTSIFTVELFYDTILLLYFGNTRVAIDTLKLYLSYQLEDGFLLRSVSVDPRVNRMNPYYRFEKNEHAQPFLFQLALLLARVRGETDWIDEKTYGALKRYLRHWRECWTRDDSGLCVWNSAQHGSSDNAFDRAGTWRSMFCAGADLNSYLYGECLAGRQIALALEKNADADEYTKWAEKIRGAVQNSLWDEKDGLFYDRDVRTGTPIRVKHCHLFDVLEYGLATPEQAKRMIEEHLLNPREFWTSYPIPSYAKTEPGYIRRYVPAESAHPYHYMREGHPNWRGGMWPHSAYALIHGLTRYGYGDAAMEIAARCEELVARNPSLHEWYDAEDGTGLGGSPFHAGVQILMAFLRAELNAGADPFVIEPVSKPYPACFVAKVLELESIPELF